ncbi:uncharacterized protein BDZ83DRAFT_753152 [Colletotrichum acutatum]|uniref:Uncharacterized protein n=1 Tax=Glomerella acutata TaxID=27357 RepID=A0AAD8XE23_GLOAC|nr:uncharacterized protein BDZ83DRAFT_753152 [Colletotrichum acutatum]KAK1723777.1 hypothetical protein BDZ83DRAFT_753152 [Colletotrichum acutatum]
MQPATNKAVLLIAFAINSSPRFGAVVVCSSMHVATDSYTITLRMEMPSDPHAYEAHTVPLQTHGISKSVTTPAGCPD